MSTAIRCVEMHTTGEPTRIVYDGYPSLKGTLLEQRELAKQHYDHIRRKIILEPRGHHDMYGAILRPTTELVEAGEADMGILFLTNEGYSNMCGHATIALGRFLVDTEDLNTFPKRRGLRSRCNETYLRLHLPCGLVVVTVPTLPCGKADSSKPVSFVSVPSFASGIQVPIQVPQGRRWRTGKSIDEVTVDFAFGGAFFCLVRAPSLYDSRCKHNLSGHDLKDLDEAAFTLIDLVNESPQLRRYVTGPMQKGDELGTLAAVVVVFKDLGRMVPGTKGVETGVCLFDGHQIDRSPTGSAVGARVALAHAKGELSLGEAWTYQSLLSNSKGGRGSFVGSVIEEMDSSVRVKLEGFAYYTGSHTFIVEEGDMLGDEGFTLDSLRAE